MPRPSRETFMVRDLGLLDVVCSGDLGQPMNTAVLYFARSLVRRKPIDLRGTTCIIDGHLHDVVAIQLAIA
jgi:hypothetical protein